jgi:D-alanyl-D-alanine carboxypeptidase
VIAWSAGSLVSTPSDVTRWLRALVAGDVLDAGHRALMTTPTPQSVAALRSLPAFGRLRWTGAGLGLFRYEVTSRGVGWGHEGLIDGFTANAVHMVDDGATVAVTSNFQMTDSFAALGAVVSSLPASGSDTAHQRWPTTHAYRPGPRMHPGPAQQVGTVGA